MAGEAGLYAVSGQGRLTTTVLYDAIAGHIEAPQRQVWKHRKRPGHETQERDSHV